MKLMKKVLVQIFFGILIFGILNSGQIIADDYDVSCDVDEDCRLEIPSQQLKCLSCDPYGCIMYDASNDLVVAVNKYWKPNCPEESEAICTACAGGISLGSYETKCVNNNCIKVDNKPIIKNLEKSTCGNGICEEGEADESDPGGCGPNSPSNCLGPPASFKKGTCPEDCKDSEEDIFNEEEDEESKEDDKSDKEKDNKESKNNKIELKSELKIEEEVGDDNKKRLKYKSLDGKAGEIKIMPETASEKAVEKLRLKTCSKENNCEIVLKEVGKEKKVVYEVGAEKEGWFLGLFKVKSKVLGQIDIKSGEVVGIKKPWWSFLVIGF